MRRFISFLISSLQSLFFLLSHGYCSGLLAPQLGWLPQFHGKAAALDGTVVSPFPRFIIYCSAIAHSRSPRLRQALLYSYAMLALQLAKITAQIMKTMCVAMEGGLVSSA